MDPATILSRDDYEKPRTFEQFEKWWTAIHHAYGTTLQCRAYAREGLGLAKRFYNEAHPMLAYMRRHPPAPPIRCQIFDRDEEADCAYLDSANVVVRKFQITEAVDGRTEKLRRRQLTRDGHVDGLAKLNANDEIPSFGPNDESAVEPAAFSKDARLREMASYIVAAIERKVTKSYGSDFTLIVGFSDASVFTEDLASLRQYVGRPKHSFFELHVVGVIGHVGWQV